MSTKTAYEKTALTGGGASALDGIDGAGLLDGDFAFVFASNVLYVYVLDDDSAATEFSPNVIAPDTNPGNKRWILQAISDWSGKVADCENLSEQIQYPIPTAAYLLKAAADGSPAKATNTDADVADAVSKKHTQHTDTGTTAASFKINTGGNEADIQTTGLSADRDYTFPDIDTMLAGCVLTAQNNFEIIAYP